MLFFFLAILVVTAVLAWWISGYDPNLTGENKEVDTVRRMIRCGLTVFLMAAGLAGTASDPRLGGVIAITIAVPMVKLWLNCVGEVLSQAFCRLIDSPSDSESNPEKLTADLDRLAVLSNCGQTNEALQLCAELLEKGEASRMAMETMCFRLYDQMFSNESFLSSALLSPIYQLCEAGRFRDAQFRLTQILEREPENLLAIFLLIQVYARNLQQPEKARALIKSLEKRPGTPPMFPAYADYQIKQWLGSSSNEITSDEGIESLLVRRRLPESIRKLTMG